MGDVMFGEDLEGEVYDPDLDRELENQLLWYETRRETQMTPVLTITSVVPCSIGLPGKDHYDVHYTLSRDGEMPMESYQCVKSVENCYHAVNRAINQILEYRYLTRANTNIVRNPGYDDAFTGNKTITEVSVVKSAPVPVTPPPYGLHLFLDGIAFAGPRFYDFFEATDKAEMLAMDHNLELVVSRSGIDVAIVDTKGEVNILS